MQRQEDKFRRILLSFTIFIIILALFTIGHLIMLKNVTDVEFMLDVANRIYTFKLKEMTLPEKIREQNLGGIENLIPGHTFNMISRTPINPKNVPNDWESEQLRKMENDPTKPYVFFEHIDNDKDVSALFIPLRYEEDCLRCHGRIDPKTGDMLPESRFFPGDFAGALQVRTVGAKQQVKSYFLPISLSFLIAVLVLLLTVGFFIGWNSGYFVLFRNKIKVKKK